ncbi:MAG: metallophosphoesterase [Planctomycetes bacterium]|nr:metallophosphoesterase [Planctomycetota bacterium]
MRIFAISDLHLSFGSDKPMDIFGDHWTDHASRVETNWRARVTDDDWVLMGGDLSWASTLEEVAPDLAFVDALPGQKLMIKGNHAHWWSGKAKVERILPPSIRILQNDSHLLPDGTCVVGTRGWNPPGRTDNPNARYSDSDRKVYEREIGRLKLSIDHAKRHAYERLWALIHYPPVYSFGLVTDFVPILEGAGVELCIYGHLHGRDLKSGFEGRRGGIDYHMVSVDHVDMTPQLMRATDS